MGRAGTGLCRGGAFSLVEVVIALGVCAVGLVALLGLLAAAARGVTEMLEADEVSRVLSAVAAEIAYAEFGDVVAALQTTNQPAGGPRTLFATRDGAKIGTAERLPAAERFFAIVLERDETLSPAADDGTAGFVAFQIRIEWPCRLPDGSEIPDSRRSVCRFSSAKSR